MRRKQILLIPLIVGITLFTLSRVVSAASLTSISDTLSTIKTSTAANQTIAFTLSGSQTFAATETIVITYPSSSFTLSALANTDATDYDITVGGTEELMVVAGACASQDAIEITSISATVITFTACSSYTVGSAGAAVVIEIGTHATSGGTGNSQITNPSSANTYVVTIAAGGDSGSFASAIITNDQVTVTASVDPTLTVVLSANACALGTLATSRIDTCSYTVTVSTNAQNGYNATIKDDGDLRMTAGPTITDATGDNDVDQGSEEYGVGTSKTGQTITQYTTCTDPASNPQPAKALTTSTQQFANAAAPISSDVTTLCHAASITGSTEAGSYSNIATIVVTATF